MNGPDRLLLRLIALAALVVGGVVATARTHASWMLVLTVVGLVAAAGVMARCAQALLSEDDRPAPARARRVPVAAFGAVAAFAVVLAVAPPYASARRRGRLTVAFVLRPATGAEAAAFEAPSAAWRIASGATAVLAPVLLNGGVS
jgi:hypothetical protein